MSGSVLRRWFGVKAQRRGRPPGSLVSINPLFTPLLLPRRSILTAKSASQNRVGTLRPRPSLGTISY
jgi:hypothetical protein